MDATTSRHHPEQLDGEIYLGNTDDEGFYKSCWRTKRRGTNPLMADGSPYTGLHPLYPWFVSRHEVQQRADDEPMAREALQPMIDTGTALAGTTLK